MGDFVKFCKKNHYFATVVVFRHLISVSSQQNPSEPTIYAWSIDCW